MIDSFSKTNFFIVFQSGRKLHDYEWPDWIGKLHFLAAFSELLSIDLYIFSLKDKNRALNNAL